MSDDTNERAAERLRMARAARARDAATSAASTPSRGLRGAAAWPVGARVFDVQLAQEGAVVEAPAGAAAGAGSVFVTFDSGITDARDARYLLRRPIPPGGLP